MKIFHLKQDIPPYKAYKEPMPGFCIGLEVRYEGKIYKVLRSSHTHSQLEGLPYAIANWQLKEVRRRKKKTNNSPPT